VPRADLILHEKVIDEGGNLMELSIWKVPTSKQKPAGVRYRLAFVRRGEPAPAVLYDNHHPKGHHRHIEGVEEPYAFVDVDRLLQDFVEHVRRITGDAAWPRR
jgi:hypothetical protein